MNRAGRQALAALASLLAAALVGCGTWGPPLERVRVGSDARSFVLEETGRPDRDALEKLARLLALAERTRVHLIVTGLGTYRRDAVPPCYAALDEAGRWAAQARFWEAVAETGAGSPAIFAYDLMNPRWPRRAHAPMGTGTARIPAAASSAPSGSPSIRRAAGRTRSPAPGSARSGRPSLATTPTAS